MVPACVLALALGGCSLGGGDDEKKPPRPRGPVVAVVLDQNGENRASIQADGAVEEAVPDGHGGWFVSGQFRNIGGYDRGYLAHIDSDGGIDPKWKPSIDRNETTVTVTAHLAVGDGRVYMTGDFGSVSGTERVGGAAVDAKTGQLDPGWRPQVGIETDDVAFTPDHVIVWTGPIVDAYDPVSGGSDPSLKLRVPPDTASDSAERTLLVSGQKLYLGGFFESVNGVARYALARVDARTGRLDKRWRPSVGRSGAISGIAVTPSAVYATGGPSRTAGVKTPGGLVSYDPGSGRVGSLRPPQPGRSADNFAGSYDAVAVVAGKLFVGGEFGRAPTHGFLVLDPRTSRLLDSWHPSRKRAAVRLVVASGSSALVAGTKIGP